MFKQIFMFEQMYSFFEKFNILTTHQFGFEQRCAAFNAVRQLYDEMCENINNKRQTCAIFLDLRKAF